MRMIQEVTCKNCGKKLRLESGNISMKNGEVFCEECFRDLAFADKLEWLENNYKDDPEALGSRIYEAILKELERLNYKKSVEVIKDITIWFA